MFNPINVIQSIIGRLQLYTTNVRAAVLPVKGLQKWSDGSTDADGTMYPTNINDASAIGAVQTAITADMTAANYAAYGTGIDTGSIANGGFKRYVFGQWAGRVRRFKGIILKAYFKLLQSITNAEICVVPRVVEVDATHLCAIWYVAATTKWRAAVFLVNSDGSLTMGTPIDLTSSASVTGLEGGDVALIDTNKVMFVYKKSSGNYCEATCATISGTTLTAGTPAAIDTSAALGYSCHIAKLNTGKAIIQWVPSTSHPKYVACSVSGTTITVGSAVQAGQGGNNNFASITQNGTDKAFSVICNSAQTGMWALSMTVSTLTITLGTEVAFALVQGAYFQWRNAQNTSRLGNNVVQCTTDKMLVMYSESGSGVGGNADTDRRLIGVICTMATNVVTIQTATQLSLALTSNGMTEQIYDGVQNLLPITANATYLLHGHSVAATNLGTAIVVTVSSNTVTAGTNKIGYSNGTGQYVHQAVSYNSGGTIGFLGGGPSGSANNFDWSCFPTTYTMEVYNKDTIIGSANTCYGSIGHAVVSDSAVEALKAYIKLKLTSATTIFISIIEACFEVQ